VARAVVKIALPLRTSSGPNAREHFHAKASRVRKEREAVAYVLGPRQRPHVPCSVTLTRVAPSNGLDDDNLAGSLKGVRDQVAHWLGVDDRHSLQVKYRYAQRRGPWGVEIEFGPPVRGAQETLDIALPPEVDAFGIIPERKTEHAR
jgi:hypothetical protein